MKRLVLLLLVGGCNEVQIEPVHHPLLIAGPIDCGRVCIAVSHQLFDAGVTRDCTEPEFTQVTDCAACREVLLKYAVELPACE